MSVLALALISGSVLAAADSPPNTAADRVRRGVERYAELDYRNAATAFKEALEAPDLSEEDRVLALGYLARTQAVLERPRRAARTFMLLLKLEPGFAISWEESPRIQEAFAAAQKMLAAQAANPGAGGADDSDAPVAAGKADDSHPGASVEKDRKGRGPRRGARGRNGSGGDKTQGDEGTLLATLPPSGEPNEATEVAAAPSMWSELPEWAWWAGGAVLVGGAATAAILLSSDGGTKPPRDAPRWQLP